MSSTTGLAKEGKYTVKTHLSYCYSLLIWWNETKFHQKQNSADDERDRTAKLHNLEVDHAANLLNRVYFYAYPRKFQFYSGREEHRVKHDIQLKFSTSELFTTVFS